MPRVKNVKKVPCQYCLPGPRNKPRTRQGLWDHWQEDHWDLYVLYHERFGRPPSTSDDEEEADDNLDDGNSGDDMQLDDAAQSASRSSDAHNAEAHSPVAAAPDGHDAPIGAADAELAMEHEEAADPAAAAAQHVPLPDVSLDAQQPDATVEYDGMLFTVEQLRALVSLGQQYADAAEADERILEAMTTEQLRSNLTTQVSTTTAVS